MLQVLRNFTRLYSNTTNKINPGIHKRLKVLNEDNLDEIDLEELESDFMNVGSMHKAHEKELKYLHEKEKYFIVRHKYFKEKKINFLSWNDKEQIRYLHESNPEEWTVEKLSEGFPALPETISKIIKSKWQVKSESKREVHDKSVEKNWNLFRSGKLHDTLPSTLVEHLSKFTNKKRNFKPINNNKIVQIVTDNSQRTCTEFSSIITSYEKLKNKNVGEKNTEQRLPETHLLTESKILNKMVAYGKTSVPLSVIKSETAKIETRLESNRTEQNADEINEIPLKIIHKQNSLVNTNDSLKNQNTLSTNNTSNIEIKIMKYPEKITIPKNKYKKGFTYKLNDCYYDDDGEFLYRVPGMY